jgi:hypothetical protein
LSIFPQSMQLLSPCLHMLPKGHTGLKNQEVRALPAPQSDTIPTPLDRPSVPLSLCPCATRFGTGNGTSTSSSTTKRRVSLRSAPRSSSTSASSSTTWASWRWRRP